MIVQDKLCEEGIHSNGEPSENNKQPSSFVLIINTE